ncbi:rhodanese-like domain-containing protein [Nocardioides nanhaiensis]|uniref:Rhodanese-like domain-containing protein n=1 Tax=Nocardioides nanhaiensis TaxID=1476871 RepID=A0ABP8VPE5_9ACTN
MSAAHSSTPPQGPPAVPEIDVHRAARLAAEGVLLLDVREDAEWEAGHAPGARHVPLAELDPASLPVGEPIVAVCRSGNRSGKASTVLAAAGHDVVNMTGGMQAWQAAGLPVQAPGGGPGSV